MIRRSSLEESLARKSLARFSFMEKNPSEAFNSGDNHEILNSNKNRDSDASEYAHRDYHEEAEKDHDDSLVSIPPEESTLIDGKFEKHISIHKLKNYLCRSRVSQRRRRIRQSNHVHYS